VSAARNPNQRPPWALVRRRPAATSRVLLSSPGDLVRALGFLPVPDGDPRAPRRQRVTAAEDFNDSGRRTQTQASRVHHAERDSLRVRARRRRGRLAGCRLARGEPHPPDARSPPPPHGLEVCELPAARRGYSTSHEPHVEHDVFARYEDEPCVSRVSGDRGPVRLAVLVLADKLVSNPWPSS
jgi:hypothetical protein